MTAPRNDDAILAAWLDEGPTELPDGTRRAIVAALPTTTQARRGRFAPWRSIPMSSISRAATAIAVVAIAAAGTFYLFGTRPGTGGPGAMGTPVPTSTPAATAGAEVSPGATPDDAACLLTPQQVDSTSGNPGLGAHAVASVNGSTPSCTYWSGGNDVYASIDLTKPGGAAAFTLAQSTPGVQTLSIAGAEAVFDPASGFMYVVKGDAMATIRPGFMATDGEKKLDQTRALAFLLIPRL